MLLSSTELLQVLSLTFGQNILSNSGTLSPRSKKENKQKEPNLGAARIRLERLVWDERVMAFVVRILPSECHQETNEAGSWPCANATPHITVGTASPDIKPKESNEMLRRWLEGDHSQGKIWEREVPEMKVLEGTVRAVMQKR